MAVEINELGAPVKEDQDAIEKSQHMIQSFVSLKNLRGLILLHMGDIMVRLRTYIPSGGSRGSSLGLDKPPLLAINCTVLYGPST